MEPCQSQPLKTIWMTSDKKNKNLFIETPLSIWPTLIKKFLILGSVDDLPKIENQMATEMTKKGEDFEEKMRTVYRKTGFFQEDNRAFVPPKNGNFIPLDSTENRITLNVLRDIDGNFLKIENPEQKKDFVKFYGFSVSFSSQENKTIYFFQDTLFEVKTRFSIEQNDSEDIKLKKIEMCLRRFSLRCRILELLKNHSYYNLILYFNGNDELEIKKLAQILFKKFPKDDDFRFLIGRNFFMIFVSYTVLCQKLETVFSFFFKIII